MVELADTQDLGSCAVRCAGSSPVARTILRQFLTASFLLPIFPKMPENGLNTGILVARTVKLKMLEKR